MGWLASPVDLIDRLWSSDPYWPRTGCCARKWICWHSFPWRACHSQWSLRGDWHALIGRSALQEWNTSSEDKTVSGFLSLHTKASLVQSQNIFNPLLYLGLSHTKLRDDDGVKNVSRRYDCCMASKRRWCTTEDRHPNLESFGDGIEQTRAKWNSQRDFKSQKHHGFQCTTKWCCAEGGR